MACDPNRPTDPDVIARYEQGMKEIRDRIAARGMRIDAMLDKAKFFKLNVTREQVERNYRWFCRWDDGEIATGYLCRRTGIKRTDQPVWRKVT